MLTPTNRSELADCAKQLRDVLSFMAGEVELETPNWRYAIMSAALVERSIKQVLEYLVPADIEQGASWTAVAESLGVTRQAAHQRYSHLVPLD